MNERAKIIGAIKAMRELLGIKQKEIAKEIGITASTYNNFERLRTTLSKEKIFKIATILKINPEWLTGKSDIFLKTDNVLYLTAKKEEPLWTFQRVAKNCSYLHIFIVDTPIKYLISKHLRRELVVTIAKLKDNFCVIETPNLKSMEDFDRYFMYKALKTFHIPTSSFVLEHFENKNEILAKIKNKAITKEDLINLYNLAKVATVPDLSFSVEEKDLVLTLREQKISATEAKKILLNTLKKSTPD